MIILFGGCNDCFVLSFRSYVVFCLKMLFILRCAACLDFQYSPRFLVSSLRLYSVVFAEMLLRRRVLKTHNSTDEKEMLKEIWKLCGTPTWDDQWPGASELRSWAIHKGYSSKPLPPRIDEVFAG